MGDNIERGITGRDALQSQNNALRTANGNLKKRIAELERWVMALNPDKPNPRVMQLESELEAARSESVRRLSWMMHQLGGPLTRIGNVVEELVDFAEANPQMGSTLLPDEQRARARAEMNRLPVEDYTLHARLMKLADAVDEIRRLGYLIRRYKNAQADRRDTRDRARNQSWEAQGLVLGSHELRRATEQLERVKRLLAIRERNYRGVLHDYLYRESDLWSELDWC